ncbi:MAG: SEC-C domain-containing protein [Clostridium sp.]
MQNEIFEREIEKIKSKLVAPVSEDFNLNDYLNIMTKDELTNIRRTLEVKGVSSYTKGQLIEKLEEVIKGNLVDILHNITEREYYMLLMMIPKNGATIVNLEDLAQFKLMLSLRNWGIVYTGKINDVVYASIPRDIFDMVKANVEDAKISDSVSNTQKWLRAASGLLYFYGALTKRDLYDMLVKTLEEDKSYDKFEKMLDNAAKNSILIKSSGDIYYYYKAENPESIVEAHKSSPLDYLYPGIKVIYTFGMEDAFNYNEDNFGLYEYITKNFKMLPLDTESLISNAGFMINNDYPNNEIVDYIINGINSEFIHRVDVENYVNKIKISIPLWKLKGNPMNEVLKNIGRNDNCFCGSGKKYKKCCEGK